MNFDLSFNVTTEEILKEKEESQKVHFKTDLAFLQEHNGFRPGYLHLFLGISGGGKSTTFRTIFEDVLRNKEPHQKIGIWLSEESESEFKAALGFSKFQSLVVDLQNDIRFYSELDSNPFESEAERADDYSARFDQMLEECAFVFYDNITTSSLYNDLKPSEQDEVIKSLKAKANHTKAVVIIFTHTGAQVDEGVSKLITQNDIRGSKTINSYVQFYYIIQRISIENQIYTFLRIVKFRTIPPKNNVFRMYFDAETKTYSLQKPIMFSKFAELFSQRDRLGTKPKNSEGRS